MYVKELLVCLWVARSVNVNSPPIRRLSCLIPRLSNMTIFLILEGNHRSGVGLEAWISSSLICRVCVRLLRRTHGICWK